jgi:hypothetical protein
MGGSYAPTLIFVLFFCAFDGTFLLVWFQSLDDALVGKVALWYGQSGALVWSKWYLY